MPAKKQSLPVPPQEEADAKEERQLAPRGGAVKTKAASVELDARLRRKAHLLAERMFARRKELRELMGASPYRGEELASEERKAQYQELKGNKAILIDTLANNCTIGSEGELRIDKKLLDAFVTFGG